jgi:hypothetical protein
MNTRNGNEWKQLEHSGTKGGVLLPIVSNASFLNPQGLGKKPAMRNEAKTVKKVQCDDTRGGVHVRQLASPKNVKINAESHHVGVCGGCGKVLRRSTKEE